MRAVASKAPIAGDAGDITIEARNIILSAGAEINSQTFSQGEGGNIILRAAESVRTEEGEAIENGYASIITAETITPKGRDSAKKVN